MKTNISQEDIEVFLNGSDPEKYIVGLEYDYRTNKILKIIQDPERGKIVKEDKLTPFLWCGDLTGMNFYNNSKSDQKKKMNVHGILIKKLRTDGNERLENGLTYLVESLKSYTDLINFFKEGGIDIWGEKYKEFFQILKPVEQFLVQKKKRLYKGLDEYSDVHRLVFDIETTGLDPNTCKIILIGVKNNRGFKEVISAFGEDGEQKCIKRFFEIIRELKPSIIGGYNSAFFDFPFIMKRATILKMNIRELTQIYTTDGIKMREGVLKLASEVEPYNQYILWGFEVIDISHAVRRAQAINSDIKSWGLKYITKYLEKEKENRVYVDGAFISKIYLENEEFYVNPKSGKYKKVGSNGTENLLERFPNIYEKWGGQKIVEQYLDDDLYETLLVDDSFSQSTFLLSKVVPTTYERVSTMGTATLWKMIMSAWSYENGLAIPEKAHKRSFTGGLSRLINVGYAKNVVKFDFSSLYPSIQLVYDIFPECDIMGAQKSLLKYFRDTRIHYKKLTGEFKDSNPLLSETYDRKQLPLKIFINAYFGSLSAPNVFPWGDVDKGEMITCTGRQALRMQIMFFINRGYLPLVMDTDGVNFSAPDNNVKSYIGKGLNELVVKDKVYEGVEADVAEFNDIFMRNEMGLDIDYVAPSCVNVSRKNYIIKFIKKGKVKIKLTGNTIKSKKIQQYVNDFLDEGFKYLLDGDGLSFVELYYDQVERICSKEIPLSKIANKARVKASIEDYKKHIKQKTKSGSMMSRQAHMELVMANEYNPSLGETIYYVNNGTKKSQGDVVKIVKKDPSVKSRVKKDTVVPELTPYEIENGVQLNCYIISEEDIVNNPTKTGDYNVARYLSNFNKRVAPLLVAFSPEIRDQILIEDPKDRQYFTKSQCELCCGYPIKDDGQDKLDDVLTLSDSEVIFWNKMGVDPFYMYIEDSLKYIDQKWIDHNRNVLQFKENSTPSEDEDIIETNGNDYATVL